MAKAKQLTKRIGRKWFDLTPDDIAKGRTEESIIAKCKEVWAMDGTDEEASAYAEVSTSSLSRYLKEHPKTKEIRDRLKQRPILKARQIVMQRMSDSYQNAMDYLKRKKRLEFGDNVDHTSGGQNITPILVEFINKNEKDDKDTK